MHNYFVIASAFSLLMVVYCYFIKNRKTLSLLIEPFFYVNAFLYGVYSLYEIYADKVEFPLSLERKISMAIGTIIICHLTLKSIIKIIKE